jgi:uncharacterized protein (DUF952 family)
VAGLVLAIHVFTMRDWKDVDARDRRRHDEVGGGVSKPLAMTVLYKILPAPQWRAAEPAKQFGGSEVDLRDGFIHFSTAEQVEETAARHFAGQDDLLLVRVDSVALGTALKWEPSRGGALFPHLYGALDFAAVTKVEPLPLGPDGRHRFPPLEA